MRWKDIKIHDHSGRALTVYLAGMSPWKSRSQAGCSPNGYRDARVSRHTSLVWIRKPWEWISSPAAKCRRTIPACPTQRHAQLLLGEDAAFLNENYHCEGSQRLPSSAICRGHYYADLGLVEEYRMVSANARRDVKVTMTGPHMLAKVAWDEHYGDIGKMMADLGKVINRNFKDLQAAGCKYVQIDEPLFVIVDEKEVEAAVEAINLAIEGLDRMSVHVHVCQGNYAVGPEYDGQIGHRYFDTGRYPAEIISKIKCDVLLIEHDQTPQYEGLLGNKYLAVGAADVQDLNVESAEKIAERIKKHSWLAPEQTLITSSCGMNHLPRHIAYGKLRAMAGAKSILST
jgi:hypothetical protein